MPSVFPIFLERSRLTLSVVTFCFYEGSFHEQFFTRSSLKALSSLHAILWNSAFSWGYLSLSPLIFTSLLSSAVCKASSDTHFAFLHFFFFGMVLISITAMFSIMVYPIYYVFFSIMVYYPVECYGPLSKVLQALCLLDLIP